jgi:hypothetical protein
VTTTSTELTRTREHLAENRRMIIGRSLISGVAGALPVPVLEEWLSATVQRGTIKRIAEKHRIDLDSAALRAIADGPARPPEWTEIVGGGIAWRLLSGVWRRFLIAALAARRAQAAGRAFAVATLFDHYCARLHTGLGLDAVDGAQVRALIDQAIEQTEGGLARTLFRRGLLAAARAGARAPVKLANALTGGAIHRLLGSGEEDVATAEVEDEIDRQLREEDSFLARAVTAVELQLAAESLPYLDRLIDNFEGLYRSQVKG